MKPISTLEVSQEDVDKAVTLANKHFNAIAFKSLMEKFEVHVDEMVDYGKKIKVGGIETERKSIDLSTTAKRVNHEIDKARMAAKRPYLDFNQQLDGMVRPIQKLLTTLEKDERGKCIAYRNELLRKENEAIDKATKEAAEAEAIKSKINSPLAGLSIGKPKPIVSAVAKVDSMHAGSGSYKKIIVPELVDITKVPAKYLLVDWKAVKAAQKNGVTKIDGINFVEKMGMTLRS
jgi:hypothetical protein